MPADTLGNVKSFKCSL